MKIFNKKKNIIKRIKEIEYNKLIAPIGLFIALVTFFQGNYQNYKNNIQFKKNSIIQDSLFKTQLKHSEKLNQLQISNTKSLNDSLINELNEIQKINYKHSLSAENQLKATEQQLILSKQTLGDYLYESRAQIILSKTKIQNIDTIDENAFNITIVNDISNIGKRDATEVEFMDLIIFNNHKPAKIHLTNHAGIMQPTLKINRSYSVFISPEDYESFFYWIQIRFYDEKLNEYFDKSYFRHYHKVGDNFDFYFANNKQKSTLQKIINEELKKENLN